MSHYLFSFVGKPVAVTHSKGQGSKQNPSSSLAWEQAEWRKMKDSKLKGEKPAGASTFDGKDIGNPLFFLSHSWFTT